MKSLLSVGIYLMSFAGVSAYAVTAVTAEANLRIGTAAKTPVEAIEKCLSVIKTDRRLLDEIAKRLVLASSWKLDDDQVAKQLSERISISVTRQGEALLRANDDDPAKAAILANTAASVLRDHLEEARIDHLESKVAAGAQREAVDNERKRLAQIIRSKAIISKGDAPPAIPDPTGGNPSDGEANPEASFVEAKRDFEKAEKELEMITIGILAYQRLTIDDIRWATLPAE